MSVKSGGAFSRLAESRRAKTTSFPVGAAYAPDGREGIRRNEGPQTDLQRRLAIRYAVDGDLRFISHHDTLRLFERALARSGIPVRYSAGFNPRARISVVLPRPVGVASDDDLLLVELNEALAPSEAQSRFAAQMPPGLTVRSVSALDGPRRPRPSEACFELPISGDEAAGLSARVAKLLAGEGCVVQRSRPGSHASKAIDVRAYIVEMQAADGTLAWRQKVSQEGSVRVGEVLEALGLPAEAHLHRVRRTQVHYAD